MFPKVSSLVFLQYLTTVFDNIQDAVVLISVEPDGAFTLLLANEAFFADSGHERACVGKPVRNIVRESSYPKLVRRYKKVIATKKPVEYAEWYDVPLGRRAFEVKLIPILNAVGECVQIAAITRNVTELYTLREQLAKPKPNNGNL